MNPSDYFKEGSTSYVQTKQALDVINAARAAGLPEAEQYQKDLESSISLAKKSGWRDFSGFDATRRSISGLAGQVNSVLDKNNQSKSIESSLGIFNSTAKNAGYKVSPEEISNVLKLGQSDPESAKASLGNMNKGLSDFISESNKAKFQQENKTAEEAVKTKKGEVTDKSVALNFYQHIGDLADSEEKMGRIFGTQFGLTGGESTYSRPVTKSALSDLQSVKGSARQIGVSFLKGQGSVSDAEGAAAAASVVGIEAGEDLDQAHFKLRRLQAFMRDKWDNGYYNKWNIANGLPEIGVGVEGGFMPASATKSEASLLKPKEAKEDKESDPYAEAVRSINSIPSAPK